MRNVIRKRKSEKGREEAYRRRRRRREEERRKIMKEMKREKHASYSSHDSCKSLSEELSDYYRERHGSHTKHHSQRREKEIKGLKRLTLASHISMEKTMLRPT